MAERVIFEYRAEGDGTSVRIRREAAALFARWPFLHMAWRRPWPFPGMIHLRRGPTRRQIRHALGALQRMYDELYGPAERP